MAITDFPIQTINLSSLGIGQLKFVSNYASFESAISSIGFTPTTLIIDEDTTVSTAAVIPTTLTLAQWNQSALTKSGSGTIEFEGLGLQDPTSQQPIFSGFASGDITWTGTDAPAEISTELWDTGNSSLTERAQRANDAFPNKKVQIILYPRTITGTATFSRYRSLYFKYGNYPNAIASNIPMFYFTSDFYATGNIGAIIHLPTVGGAGFYPTSVEDVIYNVIFDNLHLKGDPAAIADPANSNIILGNVHNGRISNCTFEQSRQFTVVGGLGSTNNYSKDCNVYGNKWIDCPTQALAILSSVDTQIYDNYWTVQTIDVATNATLLDVEPNDPRDRVENLTIRDNFFDMRSAPGLNINGIAIQALGVSSVKNVAIENNIFIGESSSGFIGAFSGYGIDGLKVINNVTKNGTSAFSFYNCRNVVMSNNYSFQNGDVTGYLSSFHLTAIRDGIINGNVCTGLSASGIRESELDIPFTSTGSTATTLEGGGFYDFWVNMTFVANNTLYTVATVDTSAVSPFSRSVTTTSPIGTLTNQTFTSEDVTINTDTIAIANHGYSVGCALRYVAGTEAVGGLTNATTYYAIVPTAGTLKLASTLTNALAGTAIDLTSAGTGTQLLKPILQTRFSNNIYQQNSLLDITLEPTGSSHIVSDGYRQVNDSYAPPQITSNQNNYLPDSPRSYRLDLSTDTSRDITGYGYYSYPLYYRPYNGERHEFYNAGTFNLVIKHNTSSSPEVRFWNNGLEDITLAPGQRANLEYNSTISKWMVGVYA